jgi:hypothetical protein
MELLKDEGNNRSLYRVSENNVTTLNFCVLRSMTHFYHQQENFNGTTTTTTTTTTAGLCWRATNNKSTKYMVILFWDILDLIYITNTIHENLNSKIKKRNYQNETATDNPLPFSVSKFIGRNRCIIHLIFKIINVDTTKGPVQAVTLTTLYPITKISFRVQHLLYFQRKQFKRCAI